MLGTNHSGLWEYGDKRDTWVRFLEQLSSTPVCLVLVTQRQVLVNSEHLLSACCVLGTELGAGGEDKQGAFHSSIGFLPTCLESARCGPGSGDTEQCGWCWVSSGSPTVCGATCQGLGHPDEQDESSVSPCGVH